MSRSLLAFIKTLLESGKLMDTAYLTIKTLAYIFASAIYHSALGSFVSLGEVRRKADTCIDQSTIMNTRFRSLYGQLIIHAPLEYK